MNASEARQLKPGTKVQVLCTPIPVLDGLIDSIEEFDDGVHLVLLVPPLGKKKMFPCEMVTTS